MTKPTTVLEWTKFAVIVFAALLVASWIAGQVRGCRGEPKLPPVIPGAVDPGTSTPGPVADAPTAPVDAEIAAPVLTREQVLALAAKYGLTLAPKPAAGGQNQPSSGSSDEGQPSPSPEADRPAEARFEPRIFTEETFRHPASGTAVDVAAWQLAEGGRIVLVGKWAPWQPPTPEEPKRGYLGNESRWEKLIGVGVAGTETGAGGSLLLGLGYRGWRVGKGTMGVDLLAMPMWVNGKVTGAGGVYATLHIE